MTDDKIVAMARVIALRENINTERKAHRPVARLTRRLRRALAEALV